MAEYSNVALGTSNPIDICQGLELLSKSVPGRVGLVSTQNSHQFFDLSVTAVFSRLKLSAYYDYNMGICGPSVAFLFDAPPGATNLTTTNDGSNGKVSLSLPNQAVQAGLFMSFGFGGGVHVVEQNFLPKHWYSPWKGSWSTAFQKKVGFFLDLFDLLVALIDYMTDSDATTNSLTQDASGALHNAPTSWQLIGSGSGMDASLTVEATPSYPVPVDLVDYSPELQAFNKFLHKIKGKLQFGPQFTVAIPVTMTLDQLTLDGTQDGSGDFVPDTYDPNTGDLTAIGPAFGVTAPTQITTHVSYETGFTLELNVFFKLSACKLFNFNYTSPSLDLLSLLSLPEPATNPLANHVDSKLTDGCVLAPAMKFHSSDPGAVMVGEELFLSLDFDFNGAGFPGSDPCCTEIALTSDVPVPGLPTAIPVENGAYSSGGITVTFPKSVIPDGQGGSGSASPTAAGYTVNLTATAPSYIDPGCSTPLVANKPVIVTLPVISADLNTGTTLAAPGDGPLWNPDHGGASLNAQPKLEPPSDPNLAPPDGADQSVVIDVTFPDATPTNPTPVTYTLLDANRNPYASNGVTLSGAGFQSTFASPTISVTQTFSAAREFSTGLTWKQVGPQLNYSQRFILVIDAGLEYGQTEFWLDVWNGAPAT